jgi:hypothetical protein
VVGVAVLTGKVVHMDTASGMELAGAAAETAVSGEMADSVQGLGAGAYDNLVGTPMTSLTGRNWMTEAKPLYGHEEAFQNGRVVGYIAGFAVNMVLTVSGISGVVTGIRAIQGAGGLIKIAQVLLENGQTVNMVVGLNGTAVVATAETLASLGVSAEAAASLGSNSNMMMAANPPGGEGGAPKGIDPDIAKKIDQFGKKTLGDQTSVYDNLFKTYQKHLKKYGQTAGQTSGETNRMERELAEMRKILGDRGRNFGPDGSLTD